MMLQTGARFRLPKIYANASSVACGIQFISGLPNALLQTVRKRGNQE